MGLLQTIGNSFLNLLVVLGVGHLKRDVVERLAGIWIVIEVRVVNLVGVDDLGFTTM